MCCFFLKIVFHADHLSLLFHPCRSAESEQRSPPTTHHNPPHHCHAPFHMASQLRMIELIELVWRGEEVLMALMALILLSEELSQFDKFSIYLTKIKMRVCVRGRWSGWGERKKRQKGRREEEGRRIWRRRKESRNDEEQRGINKTE